MAFFEVSQLADTHTSKTKNALPVETAPGNSASRRLDDRCENRDKELMMGKQVAQGAVAKRSSDTLVHAREKL